MVDDPFLVFNSKWAGFFFVLFCQAETPFKNPRSATDKGCFCSYVATTLWLCRK